MTLGRIVYPRLSKSDFCLAVKVAGWKFNADKFISSFVGNNVYLTIGKNTEWSGPSAGEYIEQAPNDATIPVPIDTTTAYYKNHDDLIAII